MKETSIDLIYNQSLTIIESEQPAILTDVSSKELAVVMTTIYVGNDISKEQTIRILRFGTFIASQFNMSLILDTKKATRFSQGNKILEYEDLQEDLYNLLFYIDLCYQRIE